VYIYKRVVHPFFAENETKIDATIAEFQTNFSAVTAAAMKQAVATAQQAVFDMIRKV